MIRKNPVITDALCTSLYDEFVSDDSILGISSVCKKHNITGQGIIEVRNKLYSLYNKQTIIKIMRNRVSKYRTTGARYIKMVDAIRKKYQDKSFRQKTIQEKISKLQTDEIKEKRVNTRKLNGSWFCSSTIEKMKKPKSPEHIKKMKESAKERKIGWHLTGNAPLTFSSKGQQELEKTLSETYTIKPEYFLDNRPYDVYIKDINTIIEFYGDYWHCNPLFYEEDYYHKRLSMTAGNIWKSDLLKIDKAKKMGYNVIVIWENEWNRQKDKRDFLRNLLTQNKE
jgi:hypothetical protein